MEWVETTGRTVEEAKRLALEQLGVGEPDADFEVVSEPKIGLFGRLKEEARVRARVQPRYPRSKGERRDRRRGRGSQEAGRGVPGAEPSDETAPAGAPSTHSRRRPEARDEPVSEDSDAAAPAARRRRRPARAGSANDQTTVNPNEETAVSVEEQARIGEEFLKGLLEEMGAAATVSSHQPDETTVELSITGDGLGMLIGPKGATLLALQELTRTVLQRKAGPAEARVVVDVNGYRQRRHEALARFAQQVAAEVVASGNKRALEPMPPADRKVVHDAVNSIAGVTTVSEGEEPYRRVVLVPTGETVDAAAGSAGEPAVP